MDELVTDLTLALERTDDPQSSNSDTTIGTKDSPSSTPIRKPIKKRRGRKRRSDFPLSKDFAMLSEESNDSVEEALKDYIENITMYQSDSDDDGVLSSCKRLSMHHRLKMDPYPLPERQEGDQFGNSVTGLSKRRSKRSKKMKRAAQQSTLQNSQDFSINGSTCKASKGPHSRRSLKRKLSNRVCGNAFGETWTRRSKYEEGILHENDNGGRSSELVPADIMLSRHPNKHLNLNGLPSEDIPCGVAAAASWDQPASQDHVMAGSDTDTSSGNESEGFFTNDEGRLGDDEGEESTFEQDPCANIPWWDDNQSLDGDDKFQQIAEGVLNDYGIQVDDSKRGGGFQARLSSLKSMYESNNKFLVEAKRKINKFLHDSSKIELSIPLNHRNEREQVQIHHLASLYALHCRSENSAHHGHVILLKTRNTCKPDKNALNSLLGKDGKRKGLQMSEVKRARRMATEGSVGQFAGAIPENNIGNQMLRSMGWVPGTGLGPDMKGIVNPISAKLRPRKLGLGHAWPI